MARKPASTIPRRRTGDDPPGAPPQAKRQDRKTPRKVSAKSLENAALFYLARFSAPGAHLRRVLLRRVDRSIRVHGGDRAESQRLVDELIERFTRSGLLDDAAYAAGKTRGLRRRGASRITIGRSLRAKGLSAAAVDAALAGSLDDGENAADADLAAAVRLAQRKRLGPCRPKGMRAEYRLRDLAALARAGFGYDIARRVIDADTIATIERFDGDSP